MSTRAFIVGFSGNRPGDAPGRSLAELEAMRHTIESALDSCTERLQAADRRLELRCSAAEGADTIACEIAAARGIALHLVLPKPAEDFHDDFASSPAEAWKRARDIIEHARSGRDGSTLHVLSPPPPSPACYEKVNEVILDGSDAMIILWNGVFTDSAGGAGEMLRLTRERKLPHAVLNTLNPERVEWIQPESA